MKIEVITGDITEMAVDVIVNAANTSLLGGGGVDGSIHQAAGPELLKACQELNGCQTGKAKITPGFNLKARFVIHAVGPVWRGGNSGESELLKSAYRYSLQLAVDHSAKTIAFPNIGTGIYRFPREEAALIAIQAAQNFEHNTKLKRLVFVCFEEDNFRIYNKILGSVRADHFL
ncbi:MAG: O-acetyl-ADP-ribose deacetylase [Vicingaceae bacterium]